MLTAVLVGSSTARTRMPVQSLIAAILTLALAGSVSAQHLRPGEAERLLAERALHEAQFRQVYWTGVEAPLFLSVSREIQDPGGVDAGYDWIRFSCSADSPEDYDVGFWGVWLELLLFDEAGQVIHASESSEDDSDDGICAFGDTETWLDEDLISHSFIRFPEDLVPTSALVYISGRERSRLRLLSGVSVTPVHRPGP